MDCDGGCAAAASEPAAGVLVLSGIGVDFPKIRGSLENFENAARIVLVYKRVLFPLVYFQKLFWPTNFSW